MAESTRIIANWTCVDADSSTAVHYGGTERDTVSG